MSEIKVGDKVKVTIEGEITRVGRDAVRINRPLDPKGFAWAPPSKVEKIEPPVEVFHPGDVVRLKGRPEIMFALGLDGYMRIGEGSSLGGGWPHYEYTNHESFTSESYEKINLA